MKSRFMYFNFLTVQLLLFLHLLLHQKFKPDEQVASTIYFQQPIRNTYTIKVIPVREKTFGYEIYQGTKLLIRQENIPGFSGMKGFRRKSDAEKVAKLVKEKLSKGIMPPTVERAEMEKLKVLF